MRVVLSSRLRLTDIQVRDERGRKRLHGAFTGGFSAGYFNTVGSKEGTLNIVRESLTFRMDSNNILLITDEPSKEH